MKVDVENRWEIFRVCCQMRSLNLDLSSTGEFHCTFSAAHLCHFHGTRKSAGEFHYASTAAPASTYKQADPF